MSRKQIEVSVVMSVYNAESFLAKAIDSILKQTFKNFEFIIIDDGSTDRSRDVVQSFDDDRILLLEQENSGLAKALNKGILKAKGKYIARMDADDISEPIRLEEQYKFMQTNPDCVVLGSAAKIIDISGNFLYTHHVQTEWEEIKKILPENPIFHSSAFFSKESWEKAGRYPEEIFQYFEDKILWNRMSRLGKIRNLSSTLISYRLSPTSITNNDHTTTQRLRSICNKFLSSGSWEQSDLKELQFLTMTVKKSSNKTFNYHVRIANIFLYQNRQLRKALYHFSKCILVQPFNYRAWVGILYTFIPFPIFKFLKELQLKIQDK